MSMFGERSVWLQQRMRWAAGLGLATALAFASTAARAETDIRHDATVDAVKQVMPSVVNIGTESLVEVRDPFENLFREFYGGPRYQIQSSLGSGVIIDEDGYILTNQHVVRRARRIQIKLSEEAGGQEFEAKWISGVGNTDVALLKIIQNPKEKPRKFKAVKFAKDDDLLLGQTVLALGNPYGLGGSVSRGILSSKRRAEPKENEELGVSNWLQTDASINPGNSGGPIIDMRGELIGISEAILPGAQGIGFAIPVKEVREALSRIFVPEWNNRWFGAQVRPSGSPLVVESVEANSPAARAGLQAGDTILQLNGKAMQGFEFHRLLFEGTNSNVNLTIERSGDRKEISVRLVSFVELLRQRIGIDAQELTRELARQFGLQENTGLLVAGVEKGGPAEKAQIKRYYLLTGIDDLRVQYMRQAAAAILERKKGDTVTLSVLVPQTRGDEIFNYRQGVTELKLR